MRLEAEEDFPIFPQGRRPRRTQREMSVAESTPGQSSYPGQQTRTLYAQKLHHRRRARKRLQRKRGRHKSILLWVGVALALWLLLQLL